MSEAIAIDDDTEIDRLGPLTASSTPSEGSSSPTSFLPKSSLVAHSAASHNEAQDAVLHPRIHITIVCAQADSATTLHDAEAVRDGKLTIPIERIMPLAVAAEAQGKVPKRALLPGSSSLTA